MTFLGELAFNATDTIDSAQLELVCFLFFSFFLM